MKTAEIQYKRPGFQIRSSFSVNYKIHKAMAGLLTYSVCFQRLPIRLGMNSGFMVETFVRAHSSGNCSRISRHSLLSVSGPLRCKGRENKSWKTNIWG